MCMTLNLGIPSWSNADFKMIVIIMCSEPLTYKNMNIIANVCCYNCLLNKVIFSFTFIYSGRLL
jgi:hypothetical protein